MKQSLLRIWQHYGAQRQIEKFSCETSELLLALHRYKENPCQITMDSVTDEISDTMNMMDQFINNYGLGDSISLIRAKKIERTLRTIIKEKEAEKTIINDE